MRARANLLFLLLLATSAPARSQLFHLPTANRALFDPGGEERFFAGTVGKPWQSGTFGCVRSEGWQFHEGIDIRCLQRDARGEPSDAVLATADGTVVYFNTKPSLSNYGNYIVLRHDIEGLEVYSLYAHLREVRGGLTAGQAVKAGEVIGTLGRTSNTRQGISKDRAHVHFEINLFVNERFPAWFKKAFPTQRNDHAEWNGQNLLGLDPRAILLEQHRQGTGFLFRDFLRAQIELCRVFVRATEFPWLKRYPALIERNPAAQKEGTAGYELFLNYNGIPFRIIPRAASEIPGHTKYQLLSVNETEYRKNPCRRLVVKRGSRWELASQGVSLLDLLTH